MLQGTPTPVRGQEILIEERVPVSVVNPAGHPIDGVEVAALSDKWLVAIESETNSLLAFDLDGRLQSRVENSAPKGPMLSYPVNIASGLRGGWVVLDAVRPRLARFAASEDSVFLSSVTTLRGITGVSSVCTLNGETFVIGSTYPTESSELVHIVGASGEVGASFGEGIGSNDEFGRILFGGSRLLCLEDLGLVIVASRFYPEVRAYHPDGTLRWTERLDQYRTVSYTETEPDLWEYAFPADSLWDHTASIIDVGQGLLAVQVAERYGRGPDAPPRSIRTMFLATETGRLVAEQTNLPLIWAASGGRLFVTDPEAGPVLLRYRIVRSGS